MSRHDRRIADEGASRLFRASPAIFLLVSTQVATTVRADSEESAHESVQPHSSSGAGTNGRNGSPAKRPAIIEAAERDGLLLPLDPLDANDSRFLRQLLLTHGIEVDLDASGPLGAKQLEALAAQVGGRQSETLAGVRLLDESALDATVVIDMRDTLAAMPARAPRADVGRTHYFRLLPIPGDDQDVAEWPAQADVETNTTVPLFQANEDQTSAVAVVTDEACQVNGDDLDALERAFTKERTTTETENAHERIWRRAAERIATETTDPGTRDKVSIAWRRVWLDCSDIDAIDIDSLAPPEDLIEPLAGAALGEGDLDGRTRGDGTHDENALDEGVLGEGDLDGRARGDGTRNGGALGEGDLDGRTRGEGTRDENALDGLLGESDLDGRARADGTRDENALGDGVLGEGDLDGGASPSADNNTSGSGNESGSFFVFDEAPPGFEGLLGPITQFVDIRFNEEIVGTTTITVTAETFTFDDPESVVALLEGVYDPDGLLAAMAIELETNSHLVCYSENDPVGCGVVSADPFAVIFDESTLTLDVFVAPELQAPRGLNTVKYLDSPELRGSSILSLGAVATDLQGGQAELDFFLRGLAGYGRGHLATEIEHDTRSNQARLRELRLRHFFRDSEFTAGSFFFSPDAGLGDRSLLGAQWRTSFKTRVDLEQAFSSELVVYLQRRSIVQLVIDGRVYTGDSYPAGNQQIDTRALPDGTYEVEVRILDNSGETRTETRIFTKSADIPPAGEWVLSATAGLPLTFTEEATEEDTDADTGFGVPIDDVDAQPTRFLPRVGETSVIGLAVSRRLTDQSAWRLGLLGLGRDAALQASLLYIGQVVTAQFATSFGQSGLFTTVSRVSLSFGSVNASASYLTSRHDADSDTADTGIPLDNFDQASLSISRNFGSTNLSLRGTFQRSFEDELTVDRREITLTARHTLFRRRDLRGFMTAELQRDDDSSRIGFGVTISFDRGASTSSVFGGVERVNDNTSGVFGLATNYSKTINGLTWGAGAHATTRSTDDTAGFSASLDHPRFSAEASTDWTINGGATSRNSVASLRAHAGIDTDGVAIGGDDFAESGLIVDISGEPAGAGFDVVVNNRRVASGTIGSAQFVALSPFEAYRVKLVPTSLLSNGIGEEIYDFTLFPGGIKRIDIDARREILLVASLVDEAGKLVVDALVETEGNPSLVDSSGVFQAEVAPGEQLFVTLENGQRCAFRVPDATIEDDILIPDEPLACFVTEAEPAGAAQ